MELTRGNERRRDTPAPELGLGVRRKWDPRAFLLSVAMGAAASSLGVGVVLIGFATVAPGETPVTLPPRENRMPFQQGGAITSVAFARNGKLAVSASDHSVVLWDVSCGVDLYHCKPHSFVQKVVASPDGHSWLAGLFDGDLL